MSAPATFPPSYSALQELLQSMDASGRTHSFERLLACIITRLTGECVHVAKSGTQLGDALNANATIAIQAKRYKEATSLNLNEIEGELREIVRQAPQLEVYVLGATRSAQDIPRLLEIELETGVSIVVADWNAPDNSVLGQLCAVCWDAIRHLKPLESLSVDWANWCHEESAKPTVTQTVEAVRRELIEEPVLQSRLASISKRPLQRHFFPDASEKQAPPSFNQINLFQAIPREAVTQLQNWWSEGTSSPLALVYGQEGMGKSWVTAAFANQVGSSSDHAVFWLDSRDWSTCRELKSLLEHALRYLAEERALPRLVSKAIHKWQKPILIVLDGVNERDALESAKAILRDFHCLLARNDDPPRHIRLLFTSRERAAIELRSESSSFKLISVLPYSDAELGMILPKLKDGLTIAEIPPALLFQVARIPRYLPTCIRLLPELGDLKQITVEMVLWHDLLLRLREDSQIRRHLGIEDSGDAESVLSSLARQCNADGEITTGELAQLFDADFRSIRHDLQELRWLSNARHGNPTAKISPDHLRLGWALYLRETLQEAKATPVDMEDRLQRALEPLAAEDHRIAALRLCGRLSLTDSDGFGSDIQVKREALLRLWIRSRNIQKVNEELQFWHQRDQHFYLMLVENLLPELSHSDARQRLVLPLIGAWKDAPTDALVAALTRWIHLICGSPDRWGELDWLVSAEEAEVVIGGHRFPLVEDKQNLSLTGAAMTIISHRADYLMLRPLVLAVATDQYSSCYYPPPPEIVARKGIGTKGRWGRNKDLFSICGPLLRWSYGEDALPQLQKLVDAEPEDAVLRYGAQWMAAFLRLESVPPQLGLPSDCSYQCRWGSDPVETLLKGERLLEGYDDDQLSNCVERLGYYDAIGVLACWDEVQWHPEDEAVLREIALRHITCNSSIRLRCNEVYFSWLARWDSREAATLAAQTLCEFRFTEKTLLPCDFARGVVPHPDERCRVLTSLRSILGDATGDSLRTVSSWPGLYIAQSLNEDEWLDWIKWLNEKVSVRLSFEICPVSEVLRDRLPHRVILWLHARLCQTEFSSDAMTDTGIVAFYAYLASSKEVPNAELFEKVKQWLKVNQEGRIMFMMFRLWIATAPDFGSLLREAELLSLSRNFRHVIQYSWSHLIAKGEVFSCDTPYEKLFCYAPLDELGRFLLRHGRMDDFRRWGIDVIEEAQAWFEDANRIDLPKGPLQRRLDDSGRVESVGPPAASLPRARYVSASSAWLADRSELSFKDFIQSDQKGNLEEINKVNQAWREWFNDPLKDPGHQSRHWLFFSAKSEVIEWAMRYPDDFSAKAIPFLTESRYSDPYREWADENLFSGVMRNFTDAWFCTSPSAAEEHYRNAILFPVTETQYGFDTSYQTPWHPSLLAHPAQTERHRQALLEAKNDLEIAHITWAAQVSGAESAILSIANGWAHSNQMSERALAVSILAWIESPSSLERLQEMESRDVSLWVREHSTWAMRAWKTEAYAKRLFRRISRQTEPWLASVMLEQLRPALTSAAKWWMPRELRKMRSDLTISPDIHALLYTAYHHRSGSTSTSEKVWDRSLKDHWRGEKLDSHSESLAPHWRSS